eukprot:gene6249-6890_t
MEGDRREGNDDSEGTGGNPSKEVYYVDGEELEEVSDGEGLPDGLEEGMEYVEGEGEENDMGDFVIMEGGEDVIMEDEGEEVEDMAYYVFTGHSQSIFCVAVHPTIPGLIATGGEDDRGFLWRLPLSSSAAPEAAPLELTGHTDSVTSVGFNFNGNLLLTGSYDGTVRIWQVASGSCQQVLEGPEDVEWAAWHSKGNAVLAGSKDGTIWMWLAHNGQCMMVFSGHDGLVSAGCFSRDGKAVCSGGEDGTVRIWQPRTGACSHVFENNERTKDGHEASVTCIDTEGELLVTGSMDGTARIYHVHNLRLLNIFQHSQAVAHERQGEEGQGEDDEEQEEMEEVQGVECVAFARGSFKWLATGGGDKTLKIWDYASQQPRCVCEHEGSVVACQWHASLPLVVSASLDRVVRVWDGRNGRCCMQFLGHTDLLINLTLTTVPTEEGEVLDGIVTVSDDKTARVFVADFNALASTL